MIWEEIQPAGNVNKAWKCAASNRSGRIAVFVWGDGGTGGVYKTADGGLNWTQLMAEVVDQEWNCCAVSPNGEEMVVGATNGRLYLLTNGGTSYAEIQPDGDIDHDWVSAALSFYGKDIFAIAFNDYMYMSHDYGITWTKQSLI